MVWLPILRVEVLKEAMPFETVADPRVVLPSRKLTVPVAPLGFTVAVKVTDCLKNDGFGFEERVVVDTAVFTVWVREVEVEAA